MPSEIFKPVCVCVLQQTLSIDKNSKEIVCNSKAFQRLIQLQKD